MENNSHSGFSILFHQVKLYTLIAFIIIIGVNCISGQILSNGNGSNSSLEIKFQINKIETTEQSSVFNILSVKNKSEIFFNGVVQFSAPKSWSIIGEDRISINLKPGDSINIPLRIIVSGQALGEIGYSVVASLRNDQDRNIVTEYCYITIPRKSNFNVSSVSRILYISKKNPSTSLSYQLKNQGNIDELIHMKINSSDGIFIADKDNNEISYRDYSLPPHKDSTISFTAKLKNEDFPLSTITIASSNLDTTFINSYWIKVLDNIYKLIIPESQKCAIIELRATNIFSSEKATYGILAKGSILFKNGMDFYYYLRNYNLNKVAESDYLNIYGRYYAGIKTKKFDLRVGSIEKSVEQSMFGNGVDGIVNLKKFRLEGLYVQDFMKNYYSYGGNVVIKVSKLSFNFGAIFSEYTNLVNTQLGYGGLTFNFIKNNQISLNVGVSQTNNLIGDPIKGYGLNFLYRLDNPKVKFYIRSNYGSPNYTGVFKGRFYVTSEFKYILNERTSIDANFQKQDFNKAFFLDNPIDSVQTNLFDYYSLYLSRTVNNYVNFQTGAIYKYETTNQWYPVGSDANFKVYNPRFFIAAQFNLKDGLYVAPRFDAGLIKLSPSNLDSLYSRTSYTTFNASINISKKSFGIYSLFRYGPFTIYEHYYYYQSAIFSKWFFLMPYYAKDIFNHQFAIDIRANYINNISSNETTSSLNTQLFWYLPYDLTFRIMNSISMRSNTDQQAERTYRYSSVYFEAGLRKEFNCKQPRVKFYDLKVLFFRDLNGDRKKDANEPGIENVYSNIIMDNKIDLNKQSESFIDAELLSDQNGEIEYKNIPNGFYTISYKLMGEQVGNYSTQEMKEDVVIDKDRIVPIPILENNKIFGRVELIRDPLSSFGPLDISNIRVIAEDTQGKTYSALTDQNGNFVLYTPKADNYIVKINNIFYESFDLQQSEFVVKFNGYKQFEVTFVFEEKKRKINFDNNVVSKEDMKMDELQIIRKTTLSGKIRDAISLETLEANIEIIDNKTNRVISSATSNRLNGNYSISYVAGDNFRIEVKSNGYQDYVENLYIEQIISIQNITKEILMNKPSADGSKKQTFIIYDEKEQEQFKDNFKPGQRIPINNLNFDEKESRLSPNAYPDLDRLIELLNKNKTVRIEVAGHADDSGGKDRIDNLLALRRAKTVARYLTDHGITEDRIEIKSYSNSRPLVPGTNEKARQRNRRVEIIVL